MSLNIVFSIVPNNNRHVIHSSAKSTIDTLLIIEIILPCQLYIKTQLELVTEKSGFVTE